MLHSHFASLNAAVKLVIWDLDDTLWSGTLSEEGMAEIPEHTAMIRTLVDRGIMCSICSKNDPDTARAAVEALGIWDLFVFPHIQWSPKGQAIANMIAAMGLRAENVLFLDDNPLNLEEAQFFNPGLMTVDARNTLTGLLDMPQLRGKDDRDHSRLAQYRVMQTKQAIQHDAGLSNTEFLRQSDIQIKLITDLDDQMERVYELLNRTNQLNYTKKRANTDAQKAELDVLLAIPGMQAGLIHVQDRYGDYGIVGFFCIRNRFSGVEVHHLAFSCRAMNMGVEQWLWAHLGRPHIDIVGPVANPIDTPNDVDWITKVPNFNEGNAPAQDRHLCLVGGCDLLQVSFYCGGKRDEFVNKQDGNGLLVRYDDAGFFLNPRTQSEKDAATLTDFAGYTPDDMTALDASLASSDVIILSMFMSIATDNMFSFGGPARKSFVATIPPNRFRGLMATPASAGRFARSMIHRPHRPDQRLALTQASFAHAAKLRKPGTTLFLLGAVTEYGPQAARNKRLRERFNDTCQSFCAETPDAHFVDVGALLSKTDFIDSDHYTRTGYFKIAEVVNSLATPQGSSSLAA